MIVRRVEALGKFLDTDDGKNLLAAPSARRTFLRIEEKKDRKAYDGAPDPALYSLDEEKALAKAIEQVKRKPVPPWPRRFCDRDERDGKLRPAVDAFFDKVMVNGRRRQGAREPAEAVERNPRCYPRGGGFFQDTGLGSCPGCCAERRCGVVLRKSARCTHRKYPDTSGNIYASLTML